MSENGCNRTLEVADSNPSPKEARERICPRCRSADILALGRVLADSMAVRSAYRCRECGKEFLLLPADRRLGPRDRRGTS
jgi:DNA-directed RNA polymerase subunit RPC12/RpoP